MIHVDIEKCIGCGLCVKDCWCEELEIVDNKAEAKGVFCISCGHCVAICPENAIFLNDTPPGDLIETAPSTSAIDPLLFLHWMKSRRSIRQFTKEALSEEDLQQILEVGRYSPKGGNLQNVSFVVIRDHLQEVKKMAVEALYALSELTEEQKKIPNMTHYAKEWKKLYSLEQEGSSQDRLFFHAPCVILVISPAAPNALIAASHMETMIYSLGLGMFYSGFTTRAVNESKQLKEFLGLEPSDLVHTALVIGHPAVRYQRSVYRKNPRVIYK